MTQSVASCGYEGADLQLRCPVHQGRGGHDLDQKPGRRMEVWVPVRESIGLKITLPPHCPRRSEGRGRTGPRNLRGLQAAPCGNRLRRCCRGRLSRPGGDSGGLIVRKARWGRKMGFLSRPFQVKFIQQRRGPDGKVPAFWGPGPDLPNLRRAARKTDL